MATLNTISKLNTGQKFQPASQQPTFNALSATPPAGVGDQTVAPSTVTTGPFAQVAHTPVPGVPQSFSDDIANQLNQNYAKGTPTFELNGHNYPNDQFTDPTKFAALVQNAWQSADPATQASYQQKDAQAIANLNNTATTNWGAQQLGQIPGRQAATANQAWGQYVDPAVAQLKAAQAKQTAADDKAIGDINGIVGNYSTTLDQQEAKRWNDPNYGITATNAANSQIAQQIVDDARATNAYQTGLGNQYMSAVNDTNASNLGYQQQLEQATQATNANQTGLFNNFSGQMAGINANQTGLYNTLAGQAAAINANQTGLFNTLAGQASGLNSQQDAALRTVLGQFSQLNATDQANYMEYLRETNPLMAQKIAQGSNPDYVANQEDVVSRYKALSDPQITAQERLIAELARRKFESDDAASRSALMSQLQGKGMLSGGAVIAGQQAAQEQLAQDRMLQELGLSASAQQRALQGLAGYADSSSVLRNADDAMKHFQDVYAQNEATRVGNLAGQREGYGLQTTAQQGQRDQYGYADTSDTLAQNWNRDQGVFNAGTVTNNNNYARDQSVFNAGTTTNEDNANRDQAVFNAGTTTNRDNFGRTSGTIASGIQTNQTNLGNTAGGIGLNLGISTGNYNRLDAPGGALSSQQQTNSDNNTRFQGGIGSSETAAGSKLSAQSGAALLPTTFAQQELGTAQGGVNTGLSLAGSKTGVQQSIDSTTAAAIEKALGLKTGTLLLAAANN